MALGHDIAVTEMLMHLNGHIHNKPFSFLDIGCGNGWVSRRVKSNPMCFSSLGIDGATQMIKKARLIEESEKTGATFTHADLLEHQLKDKVDVAFSMEVLYYLTEEDLKNFLSKLSSQWVVSGGLLCLGLDHYFENTPSHGWAELNNTHMLLWSEAQWRSALEAAGFQIISLWRAAPGREEIPEGTLAIIARNYHQDKDDGITQ
jgi:predicted TPR repeat methyltransferase